jgi:ankyrin repeat protein
MAAMLGATEALELLLEQPSGLAAVNIHDTKGRTALHWAYLFGRQDVVAILK